MENEALKYERDIMAKQNLSLGGQDSYYNKDSEKGIKWDDDFFSIDWPIDREKIIISEKDSCLPLWKNIREEINSWSWN